jgi:hypothetical protein
VALDALTRLRPPDLSKKGNKTDQQKVYTRNKEKLKKTLNTVAKIIFDFFSVTEGRSLKGWFNERTV